MALGYQNPFYLKQAQKKQQSLYDGKVLLEKHDPPVVHDSEETLQLAQEKVAKFVGDFKSLAKEDDESLAKHKALEFKIERLLRAVVSQVIMCVVQNASVDSSDLQTELERTKERFENCIIKKENEYAKLWNDWYKKCNECKYDKISYDKAYNDMQHKIKRLQAQLGDLKGKCKYTLGVSDTFNPLSEKLENENVELEFQSLVRSFDQEKNNIQVQQNLHLWPYQAQIQKMSHAALKLEIKFCEKIKGLELDLNNKNIKIKRLTNKLEQAKKETEDLDRYIVVPPPHAQVYSPPKKDMSWTRLLEFTDDTITDYSRPSPTIESNSDDLQNRNSSIIETGKSSSTILSKPVIKFVKAADRLTEIKTNKVETRVKRLEMELKARTSPTKIHKVDRGRSRGTKSKEVVDYILQVKIKLLIKKLEDSEAEHQV
nr:hypothetical protein [Tanacetum cinerariifolium]